MFWNLMDIVGAEEGTRLQEGGSFPGDPRESQGSGVEEEVGGSELNLPSFGSETAWRPEIT